MTPVEEPFCLIVHPYSSVEGEVGVFFYSVPLRLVTPEVVEAFEEAEPEYNLVADIHNAAKEPDEDLPEAVQALVGELHFFGAACGGRVFDQKFARILVTHPYAYDR